MLIHSIKLNQFLSFGKQTEAIKLEALNIIIGPNGSGKSNLLESIDLLRNAPNEFLKPIRDGGGIRDWLWKGAGSTTPVASLEVVVDYKGQGRQHLRYSLDFTEVGQRFEIVDERIENEEPEDNHKDPYFYYHFNHGRPTLNNKNEKRLLQEEDINPFKSILSQIRDSFQYPQITYLAKEFEKIRLYREWSFGRYTAARQPQKADLQNEYLEFDCSNLGLVLNRLSQTLPVKKRLLLALQDLYEGIEDYGVKIEGGTVQVMFYEKNLDHPIPATRLSDGTLRYLCLLVVLCDPKPPPLICIEEPELGLHPDVLPALAELLKEASKRTQIIVTTHSDILVDAMTDQPESILVASKGINGTVLTRLNPENLKPWLEKFRLGELWTSGELGGTRW